MWYLAIVLVLMLFFYLTQINIVSILLIIIMIVLACFSKIYKRTTSLSIGFELVTPVTIILAYDIGILFGVIAGFFMLVLSDFIAGRVIPNAIIFHGAALAIISVIAGIFSGIGGADFVMLGVGLVIFRNVWVFVTGILFGGVDIIKMLMGTIPNIFINSFLIAKVGVIIIGLL